ncbi:MAG: DUF3313 domain-containing protein [Gammaproteobacteria bacterium]|nr:DUF3313 domain-containing protein [Gammaproteobacteria bacterium]MDH5302969.1 DUF3313 domain-containing protein [Gammaproteobacteria bacterium]MDH5321284.1 DUF3313 domain-containing protein [Gammaproteobacteria bacterium]
MAAAALALAACVTTTTESQSFRVSKTANVESAQIAIDADFGRYSNLLASELGIYFPQSHSTSAEDLQRIRQIFRDAFLAQLEGYVIVTEPGPRTMAVEASLVDLRNSTGSQIPKMRSSIMELAEPGSILFLMEMRDSVSNRVLARAADSAKAPTFATTGGETTDWASIEDAAQHWAALFRAFLDENLGAN